MKNISPAQIRALRARASAIAARLPALRRGADGRLDAASRDALGACALRTLRRYRAVGASLVLVLPGGAEETLCFGHARLDPRTPVSPRTCFRVASVSKLVMAIGALSLCESGILSLDRDIGAYLGYPVRSPHAPDTPVTLRMLLTHTAALRDAGPYGTLGLSQRADLRDLLCAPESWLPRAPGEAFAYSNFGAGVAGVVMERASGMPFDALMQSRVFAPLSIRASYDPRRIAPAADLADGYAVRALLPPRRKYDASALAARPEEPFCPERDYLIAAGRLITDSPGMAQLLRLLASQDGMGVLRADSMAALRACQDGAPGIVSCGRGLNCAFLPGVFPGFSPVGHQGVAYGMCAELFADPARGCGVGVMTSGVRLARCGPLMRPGLELLALGFGALARLD